MSCSIRMFGSGNFKAMNDCLKYGAERSIMLHFAGG